MTRRYFKNRYDETDPVGATGPDENRPPTF
jgi:hypothetical protein